MFSFYIPLEIFTIINRRSLRANYIANIIGLDYTLYSYIIYNVLKKL